MKAYLGIILAAVMTLGRVGAAADVVIVKSSEAEPYSQAESGLIARLTAQRQTCHAMLLKEVIDKGIDRALGAPAAVVAVGTPAAVWLHQRVTPRTLLIYCMVANPAANGLADKMPAFGVTTDVSHSMQVRLIAEALPNARVLGALYRSDNAESHHQIEAMAAALPPGWRLEAIAVNAYPGIATAIDALMQKRIDIIWTAADSSVYETAAVRALLLAALRSKVPVWGFSPAFVRAGALVGVGVDPTAQGTQAAALLLRSLAGKPPGERIEFPEAYPLAVNLIVSSQLGIDLPPAMVGRAKFVFKAGN